MLREDPAEAVGEARDAMHGEARSRIDYRTGKRIYLYDRAFWAHHIEEQRRLGEGVDVYCKRHGFGRSTFRRWAQRLEGRQPNAAGSMPSGRKKLQDERASPFLAVPIHRDPSDSPKARVVNGNDQSPPTIDVWLNDSLRVRLGGEAATDVIGRVLAQLDRACRSSA